MLSHLMHVSPHSTVKNLCTLVKIGSIFTDAEIECVSKRTVHVSLSKSNGLKAVIQVSILSY